VTSLQSVFQFIVSIIQSILNFVNAFWQTILTLLGWIFDGLIWVLAQAIVLIFTGFFAVVGAVINSLNFSVIATNAAAAWAGLDPNISAGVVAIGIPQGLQIILSGILIRLALNLIPAAFTRI
jgi:hypothetical protein